MKILQICFRMPYPLKDGGAIAMHNLMKGFHRQGCELTLLVPLTQKHSLEVNDLPRDIQTKAIIHTVKINADVTALGAFLNLFTSNSYYISRYENHDFESKLIELLQSNEYDVILFESLKVSPYVEVARKYSDALLVLRSHNVEYMIWERMAMQQRNIFKKWYLSLLAKRLKKYEVEKTKLFDALLPITSVDAAVFAAAGIKTLTKVIPSGYDFGEKEIQNTEAEPGTLFHLGALDWMPNLEAVHWFIDSIWPLIHKKLPDVRFYLAGRNMPQNILDLNAPNVEITGEVEDAIAFMQSRQIMVVPLLSGSGMRIKIIEGMALGKIIISTSIGAEGIDCTHNQNILIANTPEEFTDAVEAVVTDPDFARQISNDAKKLVKEKYDNTQILSDLTSWLKSLIFD